ncbi:Syntaxin-8 [Halotydeus destructor]|nr:Syntaxin-8 [Halotydeus destructor]
MSTDNWIREQEDLEKQSYDILQKVNSRNTLPKFGVQYTRLDAQITSLRKSYDDKVSRLQKQLVLAAQRNSITHSEAERRQRLIDSLVTKSTQIEQGLSNNASTTRTALFANQFGGNSSANAWSDDELVPASSNLTNDDLRQQHQQLYREQDRGLDILDEIITRQKGLARGIGNEIDVQNELIDDIGDNMDQTNERLIRNTRNIKKISFKSDTCCYWIIIIMLFVANIVVFTL